MINFRDEQFLRQHIRSILNFYEPNIVDETGGYFQNFKDNGLVFNGGQRHLVSSCRIVFNYCKAYQLFGDKSYLDKVQHGVDYIRDFHFDGVREAYNWTLKDGHEPDDQTNHCYGLAFVIICFSAAYEIGIEGALEDIERAFSILEARLWDRRISLYCDEASPDWSEISDYRGQNANMHCCEAMLAAFEATGQQHYIDRAYTLAKTVSVTLADKTDGLIWEHFTKNLDVDWEFNKDDPKNLYRPWGFQPGHLTEWSALLVILFGHRPEDWMIERAVKLFDRAVEVGWDKERGGLYYGFAPDGTICDDDKYFWVQAESFKTAARLYTITKNSNYSSWYKKLWEYSWEHMVDHQYGAWYRLLNADNVKYSDEKSTVGGKCDYHTIGSCWDVLRSGYVTKA